MKDREQEDASEGERGGMSAILITKSNWKELSEDGVCSLGINKINRAEHTGHHK